MNTGRTGRERLRGGGHLPSMYVILACYMACGYVQMHQKPYNSRGTWSHLLPTMYPSSIVSLEVPEGTVHMCAGLSFWSIFRFFFQISLKTVKKLRMCFT